jgi:RNA polymerase sigma-70 factor (ECF subfamily)
VDTVDDGEAIERARRGDRTALGELLEIYRPQLLLMVDLRLDDALRRRLDPADVVQDAWIEVIRRFSEWCAQSRIPFRVWVRLTAKQALLNANRRHAAATMRTTHREARMEIEAASVSAIRLAESFVASATTPTQAARRAELRTRVLEAFEELDETEREIVAMRHFEGLSNREAAAELAIEAAAASKRFTRALLLLRSRLGSLEAT